MTDNPSADTPFTVAVENGIAELRLARPRRANALAPDFWRTFPATIRALDDGQTRVLVISAEGRTFCAGMDLAVFREGAALSTATPSERSAFPQTVRILQDALSVLEQVRFPVIAAIQGACVGAGLDMIAACDLRFAAADALFRVEETNIAMVADLGSLQRLAKTLPYGVAAELALTGQSLTASRALGLGFVSDVAADADAVRTRALEAARHIAARAPLTIAGTKQVLLHARDHSVAAGLDHVAWVQTALWNPSDIAAAVQARMAGPEAPAPAPAFAPAFAPLGAPGGRNFQG